MAKLHSARLVSSTFYLLAVAALLPVGPAPAAASDAAADTSEQGSTLQEVIVTAQKRREDLQKVPVSVQVVSSAKLAQENFNSFEGLSQTLPAVHVSTNSDSAAIFIRGIGSGENQSFDQSVAMFTDDIYHGRSFMSTATFLDLDRIEVLKGPQSTFFGNNAIAGALNIVTKQPGDAFAGWGRLLYGQFGTYAAEGAVGGPITDTFGARLAITRNGDYEGWIDTVNTGEHVPRINNEAARLTFRFHPNDSLDATLKTESSKSRTAGTVNDEPFQFANCPPPAPIAAGFGGLGACAEALALNQQKPGSVPIGLSGDQNSGLAGQFRSLSTNEDVLTINYRHWGQTFTSISGFYNYHYDSHEDFSALPVFYATQYFPEKYHQFSQEFRVASPLGGSVEYLAGAYFQTDEIAENSGVTLPYADPVFGTFLPANALPIVLPAPFSQGEHIYSVFGSLSWNATNRLKLSAGFRGSHVDKNIDGRILFGTSTQLYDAFVPYPPALAAFVSSVLGFPGPEVQSRSDRALMPSADIKYQLNPQAMLYFSYRKGFKAGGFNALNFFLPPSELQFGPEHVDAYELGLKSKWLDDTLLLNLDVFRGNYRDLQVNSNLFITIGGQQGLASFVRNAAESVSQGVELEGRWVTSRNFRLAANITYLDAYYVDYTSAGDTTLQSFCAATYVMPGCSQFPNPTPPFQNLSGRPTDFAPKLSGSVTVQYVAPILGNLLFTTDVSPYFTSSYFLSGDLGGTDDPLDRVPGYVRLDATLTLEPAEGRWAFDLIGKNLTNRIIVTATQQGIYELSKEEPRNLALQFRYHW